jgi:hypothetical protein
MYNLRSSTTNEYMKRKISFSQRLVGWLAAEPFFWIIVAVLVIQAAWIALSGSYPMAFDENFHFGIIQLYAHHLSPFWGNQPAAANAFGAVGRDPSYLYQYLMSFPYRLISVFTHDQTIMVLILRALNIALLASSLPIFRRLLQKNGASKALVQSCLAIFVLLPVVPLLAAQINYDNMMVPLTALTLLTTVQLNERLAIRKALDVRACLAVLCLCLATSLVKYSFLPIFVVVVLFLAIRFRQVYGNPRQLWWSVRAGVRTSSRRSLLVLGCAALVGIGLFIQRDGINVIRYHNPAPDCSQVLTVQQCSAYGPWERDYAYQLAQQQSHAPKPSSVTFIGDWFYGMWLRSFFAVGGPATGYESREPVPIPSLVAIVLVVAGLVALVFTGRRLLRRYNAPVLWLFAAVSLAYLAALWLDEHRSYEKTGQPVAINGRYLLPVLPLILVVLALAYGELLKHHPRARLLLVGITIVSLLWGGGALTYILRSNDTWYWSATPVYDVNHAVQHVVGPLVPGYNSPAQFSL